MAGGAEETNVTVFRGGPTNRHPVDELADVRSELARLKMREDALRAIILDGQCNLTGDEHVAKIDRRSRSRIDEVAIKRELGLERLRPFLKQSEFMVVTLGERSK